MHLSEPAAIHLRDLRKRRHLCVFGPKITETGVAGLTGPRCGCGEMVLLSPLEPFVKFFTGEDQGGWPTVGTVMGVLE